MQLNFDASQVAPATGALSLETGWYPAQIIGTEEKPTKNGLGTYLEISFRISSGANMGRTIKDRLNLKNPNQQAVDIAYSTLSAICHAIGKLRISHSAELNGGALEIYIKKVARNDKPEETSNEISVYRALGAAATSGYAGATGSQVAAAPAWATPQITPVIQQPTYAPQPQPQPQQMVPQYAPAPAAPTYPQAAPVAPVAQQTVGTPPWASETPPEPPAAQPVQSVQPVQTPVNNQPAGSVPPWAR